MITRYVCVCCDRCGAPAGGLEGLREQATAARKYAKAVGFLRLPLDHGLRHEDVCPSCLKPADVAALSKAGETDVPPQ